MVCLQRVASSLFLAILCIAVAGCGAGVKKVNVTGKVVDGGKPYVIPEEDYEEGGNCVELEFCPIDDSGNFTEEGERFTAYAKADGSFVLDGPKGDGVPVGKYRVALWHRTGEMTDDGLEDVFKGKFEPEKSPFEFDITENQQIVIDVSKAPSASSDATPASE